MTVLTEKENLKFLDKRIEGLNLKENIVLAFDFDELVVPIHLTRIVTQQVSKPVDRKMLKRLGSGSFEEIQYLNSLMYGVDFKKYKQIRDKIAKETNWTDGFDTLLRQLCKKYSIIFISSGLKDIGEAKLREIGFDSRNIIGSELEIEDNKIVGLNLLISSQLKGYIIKKLKEKYKVIAIGHSLGDKNMLDNSDMSIAVNSKIPNLAKFNVTSAQELLKVIESNCSRP